MVSGYLKPFEDWKPKLISCYKQYNWSLIEAGGIFYSHKHIEAKTVYVEGTYRNLTVPPESSYALELECKAQQNSPPHTPLSTLSAQHTGPIRTLEESPCRDDILDNIGVCNSKISTIGGLMRHFVVPCNKDEKIETEFFRLNYHICY